ncbi:nitrite/sulfite reductase [Pelagibaculum spongiae]|uniref:Sulfite reductase n=1 Tax=Pelagibaculum spongiae TaxID=2080658 RepID=A0A2V1H2P6_9GAMM|nr:nitrite/sulfite reductase [Pelagibaculum spongiae]PVZ69567.1 sulfite reductase [Pelagibaculum spongiae]
MYRYDEYDQQLVDERVQEYREQTRRYLAGDLAEEEFRPLRLMNGLYEQIHAPMLRVAIPYGLLSTEQLRKLALIADKYDKGYGHITTRQNIQFNWPSLASVPDILAELASVQMHAIQTSGNCIRNVTSDPLAGVAEDEILDARPYCEIIRQWSTMHPEFTYLPRKFKIAVSGSTNDRSAARVHDIGLEVQKNDQGEIGFRVLVGGGLGRTPFIAKELREFLAEQDLLSYLQAILRVYNRFGRRDNKYKARIKILVSALGIEEFGRQVELEWQEIRESSLKLDPKELDYLRKRFIQPAYSAEAALDSGQFSELQVKSSEFNKWIEHNTVGHKVAGYRAVYIPLKGKERVPGDITSDEMRTVAELADRFSQGRVVTTHTQNLLLPVVEIRQLALLWEQLQTAGLATPVINRALDIICCPGLDFCSLANSRSIPIALQLQQRFDDLDYQHDIGELRMNISGCMNACGHHHVGHIGLLGVDKKGEEFYQLTLGGSSTNDATLGKIIGPAFPADKIIDGIENVVQQYLAERQPEERFLDMVRRVGGKAFKEAAYGNHQK